MLVAVLYVSAFEERGVHLPELLHIEWHDIMRRCDIHCHGYLAFCISATGSKARGEHGNYGRGGPRPCEGHGADIGNPQSNLQSKASSKAATCNPKTYEPNLA